MWATQIYCRRNKNFSWAAEPNHWSFGECSRTWRKGEQIAAFGIFLLSLNKFARQHLALATNVCWLASYIHKNSYHMALVAGYYKPNCTKLIRAIKMQLFAWFVNCHCRPPSPYLVSSKLHTIRIHVSIRIWICQRCTNDITYNAHTHPTHTTTQPIKTNSIQFSAAVEHLFNRNCVDGTF